MERAGPMETLCKRRILGREVLLAELLGSGSNGSVYLASPVSPRRVSSQFPYPSRFVVKVMRRDAWSAGHLELVLKEINAIRLLKHPFIVSYVGAWVEAGDGEHSGSVCLAMTYCDGGDLADFVREYARRDEYIPNDVVMLIMVQVLSALSHSHAHHIIHRDIKPANLFLMRDAKSGSVTKVLVGDYGLARPTEDTVGLARTRVGTPCYCSPEIVLGEAYTTKTDIFSAGVTFFELMTRQRPFWQKSFTERQSFAAILHADPMPRLRSVADGRYDACLVRAVEACLSKRETNRPTAFELLTSFASRLTGFVRAKNIPVSSQAQRAAPMHVDGHSPRHRLSPTSPVGRTPSRPCKLSPRKTPPPPTAAPVAEKGAAKASNVPPPGEGALGRGGLTLEGLLRVMEVGLGGRAECDSLRRLLGNDAEAFMLVRIIILMRRHDTNALESGIFRLLLSLKPGLATPELVSWLTTRCGVA